MDVADKTEKIEMQNVDHEIQPLQVSKVPA
jgi:hypothetical protein